MSSRYACIVTKEIVDIPVEMPHFYTRDVLTIAIDVEDSDVDEFLKFFKNGEIVIPDHYIQESDEHYNTEDEGIEKEYVFGNSKAILTLLKKLNLIFKEFILWYDSDWCDVPTQEYHALAKNGNIIKETYYSSEDEKTDPNYDEAVNYLNIKLDDIRFFNYYDGAVTKFEQKN